LSAENIYFLNFKLLFCLPFCRPLDPAARDGRNTLSQRRPYLWERRSYFQTHANAYSEAWWMPLSQRTTPGLL